MMIITKRAKSIMIRALERFVVAQTYIAGKVDTEQKIEVHEEIEIAEKMIKEMKEVKNGF